ncbi:hypothetical protein SETIT_7G275300v2, partial [Setaria italica]
MAASSTDAAAAAPQWPDLPPELLREISGRLDAGADLVRFLTVCRSWRDAHADRPPRFPPWQDLPPGVLRNISGRLHAAADFARFHAVCWPWHAALGRPPRFLPWLVAPSDPDAAGDQRCRCVFSGTSSRALGICVRDRRVACADGTAAWVVSIGHETSLVDPLTSVRRPFSREDANGEWPDRTHRTVSVDGSIFLYDFKTWQPGSWLPPGVVDHPYSSLRGALLCPGDQEWTFVYGGLSTDRCCAAVNFYGYIVCVDLANCYVIDDAQLELPDVPAGKVRRCSYLLESTDDELLLASVLQDAAGTPDDLTVTLHVLYPLAEEDNGDEGPLVLESLRRDDDLSLLGEDVMFLGFPGSFAVEADTFGGELSGGTAYFVIDNNSAGGQGALGSPAAAPSCSVYRYSFHDGVATLVETLPAGWNDARCMWFLPQPNISRIPARRSRKCPGAPVRIYVGDLSPKVDSYRLREMFSVYGKVASARVAYDNRGRSRGFGFVTMATHKGFHKAMAALNAVEKPVHRFTILH